jgi:hypothetical protein
VNYVIYTVTFRNISTSISVIFRNNFIYLFYFILFFKLKSAALPPRDLLPVGDANPATSCALIFQDYVASYVIPIDLTFSSATKLFHVNQIVQLSPVMVTGKILVISSVLLYKLKVKGRFSKVNIKTKNHFSSSSQFTPEATLLQADKYTCTSPGVHDDLCMEFIFN